MSLNDLSSPAPTAGRPVLIGSIVGGVAVLMLVMIGLYLRAASRNNHVALSASPKPVSVARMQAGQYRRQRTYVGTLAPWVSARIGPQYVSAYVATVLVRPGDLVQKGQVLATLDCRGSSAESKAVAARAQAIQDRQVALSHESERVKQLMQGGFTSQNEAEQLAARTSSAASELESLRASLTSKTLEVNDCVLRAPFTSEVSARLVDPGAYVRPGDPMVTVVDRTSVRIVADAPESDYKYVAPGTPVAIEVAAAGLKTTARISRRAPGADASTRTIEFEIDLPNADRALPADTTAVLTLDVGQPQPATLVPSPAATIRGPKASLFTVEGHLARRVHVPVLGERAGMIYLDPARLAPGTQVVVEGRALLEDGDQVAAREVTP